MCSILTFEYVLYDEIALRDNNQQDDMRPGEQAELTQVVALHQRQDEPDESTAVQAEWDKAVVGDEELQVVLGTKKYVKSYKEVGRVYEPNFGSLRRQIHVYWGSFVEIRRRIIF